MMRTLTTERQMIQFIYSSQFLGIHSLKKCIHNMMYRMNIHTKMLNSQKCLHYSCCGNRKLTKQIIFSDSGKRTCAPISVSSLYSHENSQNVSQKFLCKTKISGISNTRNWLHFGKQNKPHSNLFHTLQNNLSNRILVSEKILSCPSACSRYYHTRKHLSPLFYNSQTVDQISTQKLKSPGQHCRHHSSLPDRFVVHKNDIFKQYLDSLVAEFKNINSILSNEAPGEDVNIKKLNSRIVELTPLVSLITELEMVDAHVKELDALLSGLSSTDTEMKNLAESEKEECFKQMEELHMQLIEALVGVEHADKSDIILEVTAGVGGQEAMLFTGEIFNLYRTFAQRKGWSFDIMSSDTSDQGGLRKASASVCGMDVYRLLKFESGVHRVQRCPKTEKSGRIHTSTMTVAVLPQPTEIEVVLQQKDLRIETFRASGKGGQHVNTTDSAVRIVHLPTGTVAECQQERSQIKNKALAMQILRSRIYEKELEEQQMKYKADRKLQVGTAGRSEKIRTYNFPQDRITDHRINYSIFNLSHFMTSGEDLDGLISVLLKESQYQELDGILEDFAKSKKKESA